MKELKYLEKLDIFKIKLGLKNIKKFAKILNNPQNNYKIIHVAGTNGKGSTSAFIAKILIEHGYKVGLYTSPHLVKFNERIKINEKDISNKELKKEINKLKKIVEKNKIKTTFFEFTTMLAFNYFSKQKIDYAVIEVGLGGRFDATNIVKPNISVITNISKDHTKILGNSLKKIAFEKAGIIKNSPIITAEKNKKIISIFRKICKEKNTKLIQIDEYCKNSKKENKIINNLFYKKIKLGLNGDHQFRNALTATVSIFSLNEKILEKSIISGLKKAKFNGRIQTISNKPIIIIDGAHNQEGIKTIYNFAKKQKNKKILLIGLSEDKPIKMIKNLCKEFDEVVISKSNFKPMKIDKIFSNVKGWNLKCIAFENIKDAKKYCLSKLKHDDFMLVTGSLYFIGNYLKLK